MQTVRLIDMGRTWTEAAKLVLPTVPAGGERIKYPRKRCCRRRPRACDRRAVNAIGGRGGRRSVPASPRQCRLAIR